MRYTLGLVIAIVLTPVAIAAQQAPRVKPGNIDIMPLPPHAGDIEILSDTGGVDFGPYFKNLLQAIRSTWVKHMPKSVKQPERKQGSSTVEFAIMKTGRVSDVHVYQSSGFKDLDGAAVKAVKAVKHGAPLPDDFGGEYIRLRLHFHYNPDKH